MLPIFSAEANLFDVIMTTLSTLCAVIGIPWGIFKIDRLNKNKETELKVQYQRLPHKVQNIIIKNIYNNDSEKFKENCLYDQSYFGFCLYKNDQKRLLMNVKKFFIFYKYKLWVYINGIWDYEKKWKYISFISNDEQLKIILKEVN
jgi:hypothetical protein